MLQKRKRKIRQGDSHRTLNIHLLDQIWAYITEGAGVVGHELTWQLPQAVELRSSLLGVQLQSCPLWEALVTSPALGHLSPAWAPSLASCLQAGPHFLASITTA